MVATSNACPCDIKIPSAGSPSNIMNKLLDYLDSLHPIIAIPVCSIMGLTLGIMLYLNF